MTFNFFHLQSGSHWTRFHEIWYSKTVGESVDKIQVYLKSDEHSDYFTWRCRHIYIIFWILCVREDLDKSCTKNQNSILFPMDSFQKVCRLWDNVEETQYSLIFIVAFPLQQCCEKAPHCYAPRTLPIWLYFNTGDRPTESWMILNTI
jgi:hypothetical protein